jgi:Rha family phage regulatory protein
MSNPCLDAVTDELERAGVQYRVDNGGKHLHVKYGPAFQHLYVTSATPSDTRRGPLNARTDIRRHLRDFGLMADDDASPPDEASVRLVDGQPSCFSYDIAENFSKAHKDVLRAIDRVREECGPEFDQRNFAPVDYVDGKGRTYRAYRMTRDGFSLVVMGFTGAAATAWKVKYIAAFNGLAGELLRLTGVAPDLSAIRSDIDALVTLIGDVEAKTVVPLALPAPPRSRHEERRDLRRAMNRMGWRLAG